MTANSKVVHAPNYKVRRLLSAFLSPVIYFTGAILFGVPLLLAFGVSSILVGVIVSVLAGLFTVLVISKFSFTRDEVKEAIGWKRVGFKSLVGAFLLGIGLFVVLQLVGLLLSALGVPLESSNTSQMVSDSNGVDRWLALLLVVPIVAPFVEELTFRGAVLGAFLKSGLKNGAVVGVVFSSAFFAMMHTQGGSLVQNAFLVSWIFVVGSLASLLRLRTGSIFPGTVMHIAYNSATAAVILLSSVSK